MNVRFYDRDGKEIDLLAWSRHFDDHAYRTVAQTRMRRSDVITVWLGLDHNWGSRPPHVYETVVRGGSLDGVVWRWENLTDATNGHEDVVTLVGLNPAVRWYHRIMTRLRKS